MENFKKELKSEIPGFKEYGEKFLNKEVSKMDFKKFSGGYGVYAHRDQENFMIRLRTPSGILSVSEFKFIYEMAKKYNLDSVHLTTRQAIQFHGLKLNEVCELMDAGIDHNLFSRGAGGNFPRNVAMSPLAGVDLKEAFDVTPYALAANNYFVKDINKYKLPRKLKVSISSSDEDEGHCTIQDLGFVAVLKDGKEYFDIYFGGGLGRNPKVAIKYGELIEADDLLYAIKGMVELYKEKGNYENHFQARVRYMIDTLGEDGFREGFKKHFEKVKSEGGLELKLNHIDYLKDGKEVELNSKRIVKQKQKGLYGVYFQPAGGILDLATFKKILDKLEKYDVPLIRLSMTEGVYFLNLNGDEAKELLDVTDGLGEEYKITQSVSCIGVPTCQMGILESQKTLNDMIKYFKDKGYKSDLMPRVYISGCHNSCGVQEIGAIGLAGKKKRVNDELKMVYEVSFGGSYGVGNAKLGEIIGDVIFEEVPEFLYKLAEKCEEKNLTFNEWYAKNSEEVKEAVKSYIV
ncbi:MAG: nitrite/sulfite reductase [Clostridium sp.]